MIKAFMIDDNEKAPQMARSIEKASENIQSVEVLLVVSNSSVKEHIQRVIDAWQNLPSDETLAIFMDYCFDTADTNGGEVIAGLLDAGVPFEVFIGISDYLKGWTYDNQQINYLSRLDIFRNELVLDALSKVPAKRELLGS